MKCKRKYIWRYYKSKSNLPLTEVIFIFLKVNYKNKLSKIVEFLSFCYLLMGSRREGYDKGTNLCHFSNVFKRVISMCRTSVQQS